MIRKERSLINSEYSKLKDKPKGLEQIGVTQEIEVQIPSGLKEITQESMVKSKSVIGD
jgi:hypothetical protein